MHVPVRMALVLGLVGWSASGVPAEDFSMQVPDLIGDYAGQSNQHHETMFDFDREFASIQEAWVYVEGLPVSGGGAHPVDFRADLGNIQGTVLHHPSSTSFALLVPLPAAPSALDGQGRVTFYAHPLLVADGTTEISDAWLLFRATPATLSLEMGPSSLSWVANPGGVYDVIRGDLAVLRSTQGDFAAALEGCLADDLADTSLEHGADPLPGAGFWFLVRQTTPDWVGSYESHEPTQVAPRTAEIQVSGLDCSSR